MSEEIIERCPGCVNHCPKNGLSCVIGMNHFNYQPEPYWIKKTDKPREKKEE